MSTPGERIRKAAEEAQRQKEQQTAQAQAEEAKRRQTVKELERRAGAMGQEFLNGAREMRQQSGKNVHLFLKPHDTDKMEAGFFLAVGRPKRGLRGIRAVPMQGGQWKVDIQSVAAGTKSTAYGTDEHLAQSRDEILEPPMTEAAQALGAEEEKPAAER